MNRRYDIDEVTLSSSGSGVSFAYLNCPRDFLWVQRDLVVFLLPCKTLKRVLCKDGMRSLLFKFKFANCSLVIMKTLRTSISCVKAHVDVVSFVEAALNIAKR